MLMKDYLAQYEQSHQNPTNQKCHAIGIPLILISLPLFFFDWRWALGCFAAGWIFQFVGHHYEGKQPSFFSNLIFLGVGPVWLVRKLITSWRQ